MRQSMKRIMNRFTWDSQKTNLMELATPKCILIGSPGTGKSLIFFLAAVWTASKGGQPVIYLRKSGDEPFSIFYMFPDGPNYVGMYFKRQSSTEYRRTVAVGNLDKIRDPLLGAIEKHLSSQPPPFVFIDGPKHYDKVNTFEGRFDYLCTSGGYPSPKNEDILRVLIWVLDAWSAEEMKGAFDLLYKNSIQVPFTDIYNLCGGSIRDLARHVQSDGRQVVEANLREAVGKLNRDETKLVYMGVENTSSQFNRLRMMYVIDKECKLATDVGNVVHIVDSKFVVDLLRDKATLDDLQEGYFYASRLKLPSSVVGSYYEAYWHQWFTKQKTSKITVVRGVGSKGGSIKLGH
jgi:hypothetical protein